MRFRRIGVMGAGVIGAGVAQLFAQTGHDVVLVDVRDEPLERARRGIAKNLKLAALLHQEHPEAAAVLARLETARDVTAPAAPEPATACGRPRICATLDP